MASLGILWYSKVERQVIPMTAVKERLVELLPEIPGLIPNITDDQAEQVFNIFFTVKQEPERKTRAERRRVLLKSKKYVKPSGRKAEEIDAEIKELRSDRV